MNFIFNKKIGRILLIVTFLIGLILIACDQYQFVFWNQVRFYHFNEGVEKEVIDKVGYTHFLRRILTYPVAFLATLTKIHPDKVFSFQVFLNFFLSSWLLSLNLAKNRINGYLTHILFFVFIFISLFMNGRISYVFLAAALLVWFYESDTFCSWGKSFLILFLALFLGGVSSGTFSIIYFFFFLMLIRSLYNWKNFNRPWEQIFPYLLTLLIFGLFFIAGIKKNMEFFNNSILKLLSHGYGKYIKNYFNLIFSNYLVSFFTLIGILFILKFFRKDLFKLAQWFCRKPFLSTKLLIILSLIGGSFGYSTLLGFFPCYLFLFVICMHDFVLKRYFLNRLQ